MKGESSPSWSNPLAFLLAVILFISLFDHHSRETHSMNRTDWLEYRMFDWRFRLTRWSADWCFVWWSIHRLIRDDKFQFSVRLKSVFSRTVSHGPCVLYTHCGFRLSITLTWSREWVSVWRRKIVTGLSNHCPTIRSSRARILLTVDSALS